MQSSPPPASHRETADGCTRVLVQLSDSLRIALCRNGIQFLVQLPEGERYGVPRWKNRSFCTTKSALIAVLRRPDRAFEGDLETLLADIPERARDVEVSS
ncbi:MAG: hypothetical protein AAED33_07170 [Paracoccaceae bacterium]|jgi:hypothetical protein